MSAAARLVYETIKQDGTQKNVISHMQTRAELYDCLDYFSFEKKLDQLYGSRREGASDGD
jgi:methylisocitrate lyase